MRWETLFFQTFYLHDTKCNNFFWIQTVVFEQIKSTQFFQFFLCATNTIKVDKSFRLFSLACVKC